MCTFISSNKNKKTMTKVSIFYVNSSGFMAQWKGEVIAKTDKSISIKFSKNKACKFNLKDLDIDFCLVTNKPVKKLGVCISEASEAIQFDHKLKQIVLESTKGNVQTLWSNGTWEI
jgi:hypothetical protein